MTALIAPREPGRKQGDTVLYGVAAGQKIFKGALVVTRGDGFVYNLRAPAASQPDVFLGLADETVDNTTGANGAASIHVLKTGTYLVSKASAVESDIAQPFYGLDDATVSSASTNAVFVGYATELVDTATIRVKIDRAAQ
ncbi:MAG: hypothetical protein P4L33_16770 [Capsulimonadaceae bacterium]|nr:hypothetical protein [Capsulimonadaceae bacterium]